jgi:two-component system LytT family response regulator
MTQTSTNTIRVLIVDDEPLARRRLRTLLAEDPEVRIVDECGDGRATIAAIREHAPDLVFLDVQMPEQDGFGVVRAIGEDRMPAVIFVTAYDEHAVRAFEVHALDYLLKPVDRQRFRDALGRAKIQLRSRTAPALDGRLRAVVEEIGARLREPDRIPMKTRGRIVFLRPDDIDWVEADANHVLVHSGKETFQVRETITNMERRLPARAFLRVHRSTLVNVARIREIQPWFQRDYVLVLANGTRITTGRSYRDRVRALAESALSGDVTPASS